MPKKKNQNTKGYFEFTLIIKKDITRSFNDLILTYLFKAIIKKKELIIDDLKVRLACSIYVIIS